MQRKHNEHASREAGEGGMNLQKRLDNGRYLPQWFRDFHAQKDFFKYMHHRIEPGKRLSVSWVDGHIYVIDFFLWFMAKRGYTLQKCKSKTSDGLFLDIHKELDDFRESRTEDFVAILEKHVTKESP